MNPSSLRTACQIKKALAFIREHHFDAYPDGDMIRCGVPFTQYASDGRVIESSVEWSLIEPTRQAVRNWLGY